MSSPILGLVLAFLAPQGRAAPRQGRPRTSRPPSAIRGSARGSWPLCLDRDGQLVVLVGPAQSEGTGAQGQLWRGPGPRPRRQAGQELEGRLPATRWPSAPMATSTSPAGQGGPLRRRWQAAAAGAPGSRGGVAEGRQSPGPPLRGPGPPGEADAGQRRQTAPGAQEADRGQAARRADPLDNRQLAECVNSLATGRDRGATPRRGQSPTGRPASLARRCVRSWGWPSPKRRVHRLRRGADFGYSVWPSTTTGQPQTPAHRPVGLQCPGRRPGSTGPTCWWPRTGASLSSATTATARSWRRCAQAGRTRPAAGAAR